MIGLSWNEKIQVANSIKKYTSGRPLSWNEKVKISNDIKKLNHDTQIRKSN